LTFILGVCPFMVWSQPKEPLINPPMVVNTEADSAAQAAAYFSAYKTLDKRKELALYVATLKNAYTWSPSDSITMKYKALYTIGNAFIFSLLYDSAAHYLNKAYDYDREHDLGKYEGAVSDRVSVMFYNLNEYSRSLTFAKYALNVAQPRLRAAVLYQMANTHTLMGDYELAAEAYDSAETAFRRTDSPNWWYPVFFSLPTLMELEDTAGFKRAYTALKEVPGINKNPVFLDQVNLAKAEFSLLEWERGSNSVFISSDMVLSRTQESERWVRRQIADRINEKKEDWKSHREALYMMLRYYQLVHPDSVNGIYNQILMVDQAYGDSMLTSNVDSTLTRTNSKALQNLVGRIGYDMLSDNLTKTDYVKSTLRKHNRNLIIQAVLLLLTLFFTRRALSVKRKRQKTNAQLEHLKEKEEKLLEDLTAGALTNLDESAVHETTTYPDLIVLTSRFFRFGSFVSQTAPDELFPILNAYFEAFKAEIKPYGLEALRIDGDHFVAVGGRQGNNSSPVSTLKAAQCMQEVVERLNQKNMIKLSLRIGIHICTASQQDLNFWGAGFDISRLLADGCLEGDIVLSQELVKAQGPDAVWPSIKPAVISGYSAFIAIGSE
jgi:tetratricopeptide (TPR) repeat protein